MSFGQEIKDFLSAAQSTSKMLDDHNYNQLKGKYLQAQIDNLDDPEGDALDLEQKRANIAATKARTALSGTSAALMNKRGALYDAQLNAYKNPPEDPVAASISGPTARPGLTPAPAIPTGDQSSESTPMYADGGMVDEETRERGRGKLKKALDDNSATRSALWRGDAIERGTARAGDIEDDLDADRNGKRRDLNRRVLPGYADGGMVDDEDDDPNDEDDVATPAIGSAPTDVSARARTPISIDAAHDATAAGLKYGVQALGAQGGIPSPYRQQRLTQLYRGAGAAPLADMNAIYKKIDPNNEMGESERNMAALSAVYQYKLRQGDPQGAQRAAFAMLQHYRMASQRYAAISAAAAAHGDIDGAAKAAMKAYANIPDGKDLQIQKSPDGQLSFTVTGPDGKVIHQGIASPQQLGAAALGVATKGFDQFLLDAAGQRAAKPAGGAAGPKGMKEPDKEKALSAIDAEYDAQNVDPNGKPLQIGADEARAIKGGAFRIYQANPNITPSEAMDITRRLMSPNKGKPDETGFTAKKLDDEQGYEVRIGKGAPVRLSSDDFDALATARAEKLATLKKTKQAEEKKGPGFASEVIGAIGDAYTRMRDKNVKDIKEAKIEDDMAAERARYGDIRKKAEPDYAIPVTP